MPTTLDKVGNRVQVVETVPVLGAGPYVEQDGLIVMEAENGSIENKGTGAEGWFENNVLAGASGGAYLDTVDRGRRLSLTASFDYPSVSYPIKSDESYYPWVWAWAADAASDSLYLNTENETAGLARQGSALTGFHPHTWFWSRQTLPDFQEQVKAQGKDNLPLRLREDGIKIDKFVLATDSNYVPTGEGPAESPRRGIGTLVRTIAYTYDALYRLTEASYSTGERYAYSYDAVGNRLRQTVDGVVTRYQYDVANRLTLADEQAYTFDSNGNLLNTGSSSNTFDAANRLTQSSKDGTTLQPRYNGLNDRVGQVKDGQTTHFALDSQGLPEVIYSDLTNRSQEKGRC